MRPLLVRSLHQPRYGGRGSFALSGQQPVRQAKSTAQWRIERGSDRYADQAINEGLRSRAAYKLIEIDQKFNRFLRQGAYVVDLGAAPGGFGMVAASKIGLDESVDKWDLALSYEHDDSLPQIERRSRGHQMRRKHGALVCVDMGEMERIPGAHFIQGDFRAVEIKAKVVRALRRCEADVVLSDMAPSTTSDRNLNHDRIMDLAQDAAEFATSVLRNGGLFVCKIFSGSGEADFRHWLRGRFLRVKAFKPAASKQRSSELYYVATGHVPEELRQEFEGLDLDQIDDLLDDYKRLRKASDKAT